VLRHDHAAVKRWLQTIPSEWITAHAPLAVCAGWHAWAAGHSDFQNMLAPWQLPPGRGFQTAEQMGWRSGPCTTCGPRFAGH
jgi:hypothetical protein